MPGTRIPTGIDERVKNKLTKQKTAITKTTTEIVRSIDEGCIANHRFLLVPKVNPTLFEAIDYAPGHKAFTTDESAHGNTDNSKTPQIAVFPRIVATIHRTPNRREFLYASACIETAGSIDKKHARCTASCRMRLTRQILRRIRWLHNC